MKYRQGYYKIKNKDKYRGNTKQIVYRSYWEFLCMVRFDDDPNVLEWSSEECVIYYKSPLDNRCHRYYPDFFVKIKTVTGNIELRLLELKPKVFTQPPKAKNPKTKRFVKETMEFAKNQAKWQAAQTFAKSRGWHFQVLTEDDIGICS